MYRLAKRLSTILGGLYLTLYVQYYQQKLIDYPRIVLTDWQQDYQQP